MINNFYSKPKLIFYFLVLFFCLGLTIYRFASLASQEIQTVSVNQEIVERGSIVDRSGSPLAVSADFYQVGINPKSIGKDVDKAEFARVFAPILELSEEEIIEATNSSKSFVFLKRKVDAETCKKARTARNDHDSLVENEKESWNFITFDKIPGRIYPNNALASQLIGYMGEDGKGLAGIEYSQQEILQPKIPQNSEEKIKYGQNVFLTIDMNLQHKLESIALKSMEQTQAESMMLIATEAKTGEILSYISLPAANLNEYSNASLESKIDRPAMTAYEPGSVFKIFTVGLVYDEHQISPNDIFLCDGVYENKTSGGETIRIKCLENHGWLTARDALQYSCNDVLGQISDKLSDETFMDRIRQLGFGEKTGVELPGETTGSVKEISSKLWSARSKPTIAIGQEISVSALQMVQAATAIANNGIPVKLTFIKKITDKDGSINFEHTPVYKDRVFSKTTAEYVLSCMETTATTGTGSRANLHDVSIGVKTGTAQMADPVNGGYSETDFLSNCIAIFPVEDPEIILYIVVEKAKGETYAGRIVAPVIGEAASAIIDYRGMSRKGAASVEHNGQITIRQREQIEIGDTVPDFTGCLKKDLISLTKRSDIKITINGSGWVTSQKPEPGTPVEEGMTIELNLE